MGGEDFSYFLHEKPGCLFFLGGHEATLQGWSKGGDPAGKRSNCMCHNTAFDFNDNVSPLAAVFFVRLVEERLGCGLYTEEELPFPLLRNGEPAAAAGGTGAGKAAATGPIQLPPAKKAKTK